MEERDGLYFIRLEQILSPDELSCLVLMSHPHCRPEILETGKALAADINLWHNRLHISPKRIRAIYDLGAVEGLGIKNLPEHGSRCNCEACRIARASRKSVPKVHHYDMAADKPFHTVATDVKVVNTTSLSGLITQCTLWTNLVGIRTFTSCVPKTRRKVAGSWRSF